MKLMVRVLGERVAKTEMAMPFKKTMFLVLKSSQGRKSSAQIVLDRFEVDYSG